MNQQIPTFSELNTKLNQRGVDGMSYFAELTNKLVAELTAAMNSHVTSSAVLFRQHKINIGEHPVVAHVHDTEDVVLIQERDTPMTDLLEKMFHNKWIVFGKWTLFINPNVDGLAMLEEVDR